MRRFKYKFKHVPCHKWALLDARVSWLADRCGSHGGASGLSLRKSLAWWIFDALQNQRMPTSGTVLIFIAPVAWRQLTELYDSKDWEKEHVNPTLANKRVNSTWRDYVGCAFNKAFIFHVQHFHFVMEESLILPSLLIKMRSEGHLRKYNKKMSSSSEFPPNLTL